MTPSAEIERMLRTLLRNQRKLMLAMADLSAADCVASRKFHNEQLRAAVAKMEDTWNWIIPETEVCQSIESHRVSRNGHQQE